MTEANAEQNVIRSKKSVRESLPYCLRMKKSERETEDWKQTATDQFPLFPVWKIGEKVKIQISN